MKKWFHLLTVCFLITLTPSGANAQILKRSTDELDFKIKKAETRFTAIQANPITRIPPYILHNALGLIIVQKFKVGVGVGGEGGGGVALVRNPTTRQWSPPAFIAAAEGSYGLQVGAQNATTVFCIMQPEGLKILQQKGLKLGVDVRATAGPASAGGEAMVKAIKTPVLVYSSNRGLFAGVAIEGGGIIQADRKNLIYHNMNTVDVLFGGSAEWTVSGANLVNKIRAHAEELGPVTPSWRTVHPVSR